MTAQPDDDRSVPGTVTALVLISDGIQYGGHRVRCRECGATAGWLLRAFEWKYDRGEQADALCPRGHRMRHPLIYPQMVHALNDRGGLAEGEGTARLQAIGWRPHLLHEQETPPPDYLTVVSYRPWESLPAPPGYWEETWPGLTRPAAA